MPILKNSKNQKIGKSLRKKLYENDNIQKITSNIFGQWGPKIGFGYYFEEFFDKKCKDWKESTQCFFKITFFIRYFSDNKDIELPEFKLDGNFRVKAVK